MQTLQLTTVNLRGNNEDADRPCSLEGNSQSSGETMNELSETMVGLDEVFRKEVGK
jgi:hypothetical protein